MTRISVPMRLLGVVVLIVGVMTPPIAAQNVDAMAKWTGYTIIHYKVVGVFSGQTPVLVAKPFESQAQVTDRVEFELDWNQQEFKLVGTPVIRNFPSTLGALTPAGKCPVARLDGAFEYMTLLAIKGDGPMAMSGVLEFDTKQDRPAGAIPTMNEFGCKEWKPVAAQSGAVSMNFTLPPAMFMAMPGGAPFSLSPDGKALIMKSGSWVWTATPTGK